MLEGLPIEIIHHMVYKTRPLWTPQDVLSLALTSKTLYYALLGEVGGENTHDVALHKSLAGIVFCIRQKWWKPALLAAAQRIGDAGIVWDDSAWIRRTTCLRMAAREGETQLVSALLRLPNVDPSHNKCAPLCDAAQHGFTDVVRTLMADGRSDPSANNNAPLTWAAHNGFPDVVALLLSDNSVDPSVSNSAPLRWAAENGHAEVVRLLVEDGRADPGACNNQAIIEAAGEGDVAVVRVLMGDDRVDPSAQRNAAVRRAVKMQFVEVVEVLAEDPRVEIPVWEDVENGVDGWTGNGCDCGAL